MAIYLTTKYFYGIVNRSFIQLGGGVMEGILMVLFMFLFGVCILGVISGGLLHTYMLVHRLVHGFFRLRNRVNASANRRVVESDFGLKLQARLLASRTLKSLAENGHPDMHSLVGHARDISLIVLLERRSQLCVDIGRMRSGTMKDSGQMLTFLQEDLSDTEKKIEALMKVLGRLASRAGLSSYKDDLNPEDLQLELRKVLEDASKKRIRNSKIAKSSFEIRSEDGRLAVTDPNDNGAVSFASGERQRGSASVVQRE